MNIKRLLDSIPSFRKIIKPIFRPIYGPILTKRGKRIRNRYFRDEAQDLLKTVAEVFKQNNITFWLEFGTLLGAYREHDFIKHDCDVDFGAFLSDARKIRKVLLDAGFQLYHEFKIVNDDGLEDCYIYKHTTFDIFYFREEGSVLYCNIFRSFGDKIWHDDFYQMQCMVRRIDIPNEGFTPYTFKGIRFNIPKNSEKRLKWSYGENFMTPDPNFSHEKTAKNITCYPYEEKQGVGIFRVNTK